MRVRWSEPASEDLIAIYDFIARENPAAAADVLQMLIETAERLAVYPQLGRIGRVTGSRELVAPPYIIVYSIVEQVIGIEAVLDGRRKFH